MISIIWIIYIDLNFTDSSVFLFLLVNLYKDV